MEVFGFKGIQGLNKIRKFQNEGIILLIGKVKRTLNSLLPRTLYPESRDFDLSGPDSLRLTDGRDDKGVSGRKMRPRLSITTSLL